MDKTREFQKLTKFPKHDKQTSLNIIEDNFGKKNLYLKFDTNVQVNHGSQLDYTNHCLNQILYNYVKYQDFLYLTTSNCKIGPCLCSEK